MKRVAKLSLLLAAVLFIGLVIALRTRWTSDEPRAEAAAKPETAVEAGVEPAEVATLDAEPSPVRDAAPVEDETPTQPPATIAEPVAPVRTADLAAREWITFRVENERGYPVAGAEINLSGMRTVRERGSWYGWRGDPSLGVTDANGTLKLAYPVWVSLDDETGELSLSVKHPDYATYDNDAVPVAPEVRIVLKLGSVLVVSGWVDEPTQVITDVRAHFSWDVDVKPEDWLPRRDGCLTTTRVPEGTHLVYLEHESPKHGACFSAMTEFALAPGETRELHLQLNPARKLVGRLADVVPRPVVDGRVVLGVQMESEARGATILRTFEVPVGEGGTFVVERVMPAEAQIVALCKGWASKPEELVAIQSEGGGAESSIEMETELQRVDLSSDGEFVVAMEPTSSLALELRGPDGAPAAGVAVWAWPNACWRVNACGMFVESRHWMGISDAEGLVRIDDIPAGSHSFGVSHSQLDLPFDPPGVTHARRSRSAQFASGATVSMKLPLERKTGG